MLAACASLALTWAPAAHASAGNGTVSASIAATPNPVAPGGTVSFNGAGSSAPGGSIARYEWDLDGDNTFETDTGSVPTVSHDYLSRSRVVVSLRVTSDIGVQDTTSVPLAVTNPPTAAVGASTTTPVSGQTVTFDGACSTDPDGSIVKYEWDLDGNGTFETDGGATTTVDHAFASPGPATVGLRVSDEEGATATTTIGVTVSNRPPTAALTPPSPAFLGRPATFSAFGSSDPDGTIVKYEWDFGNDGVFETDTGATAHASHTFTSGTSATVGLRVTDDSGASVTTTASVTIALPPVASFTLSVNPVVVGEPVTLDGSASSDPDGTVVDYAWDLDGNGTYETDTGTTSAVTTSYPNPGSIPVGLRVRDNDGGTTTTSLSLTVNPAGGGGAGGGGTSGGGGGGSPTGGGSTGGGATTTGGGASGGGATGDASAGGGGTTGGAPGAPGGPAPVAGAHLTAGLSGPVIQKLRLVLRRGVALTCSADRAASCHVELQLAARDARRLGLKPRGRRGRRAAQPQAVTIGTVDVTLDAAGDRSGAVHLSAAGRRALGRAGRVQATLRGTAQDGAGNQVALTRIVLIRR